jgi:hypothetical protein
MYVSYVVSVVASFSNPSGFFCMFIIFNMYVIWNRGLLYVICRFVRARWMCGSGCHLYMQPQGRFLTNGDIIPALKYRSLKTRETKRILCGSDKPHPKVAFAFGEKFSRCPLPKRRDQASFRYDVVRACER